MISKETEAKGDGAGEALTTMLFWFAIGGGVHLIAYGVGGGSTLSIFVVMVAWPLALIWWSL